MKTISRPIVVGSIELIPLNASWSWKQSQDISLTLVLCDDTEEAKTRNSSLKTCDTSEWLTTLEAAEYLRLPINSLRNMTSNGQIPHHKLGRRVRYQREDLRQLLLQKRRGA